MCDKFSPNPSYYKNEYNTKYDNVFKAFNQYRMDRLILTYVIVVYSFCKEMVYKVDSCYK